MIHSRHLTQHSGLFSHLKENITKGTQQEMGQEYAELAKAYQRNQNQIAVLNADEIAKTTLSEEQYQIHLEQQQEQEAHFKQKIDKQLNRNDDSILNGLLG